MRSLLLLLVLGAGACGSSVGNKAAGEACHASSECGPDLVCDFSRTPAVCASQGPAPADAPEIDARPGATDAAPKPDAPPKPDAAAAIDASPPDAGDIDASPVDAM
jgi:hypothetical protein